MHNRPRILVVSYNIPRPDKSSGELRFANILEMLTSFWDIDFCVADSHSEWNSGNELVPYIDSLSRKGIRVLPSVKGTFDKAIKENQYAGAYFNLYWIGEKLMPLFKLSQPSAFTIVDSVDVHYAREETQAKLGTVEMSQVLQTKERELGVYKSADVTIAVSKDDMLLLTVKEGLKNVFLIPNIVKEYPRKEGKRDPIVIFVGCYAWYPNPEAVQWFTDLIWPTVYAANSKAKFFIIGSDPTPEVLALAEMPGVKVLGYVQETKPYLEMAAVSVAPLRVGGGMKGKVNEALAHGLPVVATSIGAQGFEAIHGKHMMIADDPAEFAASVIKLLEDDSLQTRIGLAGQELNSAICSYSAVQARIRAVVEHCSGLMQQKDRPAFQTKVNTSFLQPSLFIKDIGYGIKLFKREGFASFVRRTILYFQGQRLPLETQQKNMNNGFVRHEFKPDRILMSTELTPVKPEGVLEFSANPGLPLVSIIIPAYNQWEYTFACLDSVLKNTSDILYEVILADDNSTDDTRYANQHVRNIQIIRSEKNLGFLFNCNNAAKHAKGKFIVFLNNDTIVQPDWLKWFIKTMKENPDVGLVGGKLMFPTGELQEAGGIVFSDGTATNYGRYDWPGLSQYNYLKDVDYCSGALICVRTELWIKAGGFDPIFSPGYYDDTDLAMQIREMGYRTVYQPKSVVTHFEGISHGTDLSDGIKSKQPENQRIFFKKWKSELEKNHFSRNENPFRSRDRSKHRHIMLIIDHSVPNDVQHVDELKYWQIFNSIIAKGFKIILMPENFHKTEPLVTELQQQGIEVLYGGWYRENWVQWINDHAANINSVGFTSQFLADKYASFFREVPYAAYDLVIIDHEMAFDVRNVTNSSY